MAIPNLRAIRDWCKETFQLKQEILNTKDLVESNEEPGKLADALVIKEVFQSVSKGKELLASAITDKGIETDAGDTFAEMADKIAQIESFGGSDDSGGELSSPVTMHIQTGTGTANAAPSTGGVDIRFYPIIDKPARIVIRDLTIGGYRASTSAPTQTLNFRMNYSITSGATAFKTIKSYSMSGTSQSFTTDAEIEVDLSGVENINYFQIYKSSTSGTVTQINYRLECYIDLYF